MLLRQFATGGQEKLFNRLKLLDEFDEDDCLIQEYLTQ